MNMEQINREVESYLKKIAKLLPDDFETEDLLEDLRTHIYESFNEKVQRRPTDDRQRLIERVLDELGTPEDIAEEYGRERLVEEEKKSTANRWIYYMARLAVAIFVVVLASWVASIVTEGAIDFTLAVVVLLAFAVLEWIVRTQQTKDA